MTVRWAIAGPGRIADVVAEDFTFVDDAQLVAVASRSLDRAQSFADKHHIERSYGSYRELAHDPDVDAVYIATPHSLHKAMALECIEQGKAVLIEKSITATPAAAREVIDAARAKGVFCMEAVWNHFHPLTAKLHDVVNSGHLGELLSVQGSFTVHIPYDPEDRVFKPELAGGAMLDLGVYVATFAVDFLGVPDEVVARGSTFPNGVDSDVEMIFSYHDNSRFASLTCALNAVGPERMVVTGTSGWAELGPHFNHASTLRINETGVVPKEYHQELEGHGYTYEIREATRLIEAGQTESDVLPLDRTLAVQELMADALAQIDAPPLPDLDTLE